MDFISQLNIFYQKRHEPNPVYTDAKFVGDTWSILLRVTSGEEFVGSGKTKKEAAQCAAEAAFCFVSKWKFLFEPSTIRHSFLVLVDLENVPTYDQVKWKKTKCSDTRFEAFFGYLSALAHSDYVSNYPFVATFHNVQSGLPNAADHAISMRCGQFIATEKTLYKDGLIVISRDRFACILKDILPLVSFYHFTSINQCFEFLVNL